MDRIKLDEKTLDYLEDILNQKDNFTWLKNEIKKELTSDQKTKIEQEFQEAFNSMEKIYNEYK